MTEIDLINIIANVGFPMAVAAFLLYRQEKILEGINNSIQKQNTIIVKMEQTIKSKTCRAKP